jgi:hypothetical protein
MPLGVNFLFRMGRKLLAEPLEETGLLPGKYYRSQALGALEENDFPACLRYLQMAETHRKAQARMVAQLLILRCRLLQADHKLRVQSLEDRLVQTLEPEKAGRYEQILREERKAQQLLEGYIQEAQNLVRNPQSPTSPPHGEIRPS